MDAIIRSVAIASWLCTCAIQPSFAQGISEPEAKLIEQRIRLPGLNDKLFKLPAGLSPRALQSFTQTNLVAGKKDSDGDGLSDDEEHAIGTNPLKADTDGDGLLDGWEVEGVNGINLHALGASPLHKDIFVQMDFMERASATNGLGPNAAVTAGIVYAFANAPVKNADGKGGIAIHLIAGNKLGYVDELNPVEVAIEAFKKRSFDPKRAPIFHYMVWANTYKSNVYGSSGYSLTIPGSDFVVTLGAWNNGKGGTDDEKIGTFVHEIGHNLGLRHGNFDDDNYKPNHLSVMNYAFQTEGVKVAGVNRFTYQWLGLPGLNENALDERKGLGIPLPGSSTIWWSTKDNSFVEAKTDGALDWNRNLTVDQAPVQVDLNNNSHMELLAPTHAEWPVLVFDGGAIGQKAALAGLFALPLQRAPLSPKNELNAQLNQVLRNRIVAP
jgi:hypothetical protein